MPFTAHPDAIPDSAVWFIAMFDVLIVLGIIAWRVWTHYDTKNNWVLVGKKDGYTYEQHKTKRKRRWTRQEGRVNVQWVNYKTDEL